MLYASLVLLPIYLQTLLGYPAYNAGLALSPRGIGSLATMPLTGYLTSKIDPRKIIVVGLILGAITMFDLSHLNLNAGYWDIFWPQVLQGVALAFLFIPLMALSMSSIPKEQMGNATSIFNLMRNIGGSFGIAIMTTFLARRTQFHQSSLVANITPGSLKTQSDDCGHAGVVSFPWDGRGRRSSEGAGSDLRNGAGTRGHAFVRRGILGHGDRLSGDAAISAVPAAPTKNECARRLPFHGRQQVVQNQRPKYKNTRRRPSRNL